MNKLVIFSLLLCVVHGADKPTDVKSKTASSPANTIQQHPKYEMIYQPVKYQQPVQLQIQPMQQIQSLQLPQLQQKPQYIPIQFLPKQYFVPQPQPMIIIAQPALLPQSLLYGSATQQLLNYFHNNPQAKYQLLHGSYQQPQAQQAQAQTVQPTATYMHPVIASPVGNYILTPAQITPQPQLLSTPSPTQTLQYTSQLPVQQVPHLQQLQPIQPQTAESSRQVQQPPQQQQQYSSLAQLAQIAAQQYLNTQMKTAPAIVTGFEHFTPEQQAQIKAQLSTHLGSNFHSVTNPNPSQYSAKYVGSQESVNFVPSPQVKNEQVTTTSSQMVGDILKARYMKKN